MFMQNKKCCILKYYNGIINLFNYGKNKKLLRDETVLK